MPATSNSGLKENVNILLRVKFPVLPAAKYLEGVKGFTI